MPQLFDASRFELIELTGQWLSEVERVEQACFSDPWSRAGLERDILSEYSHWYGFADRRSGRLAAFLGAHVIADEAEIVNVATHPDYRRCGLANALLCRFFDCHPDVTRTFLEVRASNAPAIALYKKLGFTRYAVRRNYYEKPTEDAILMRYLINSEELC